MQTVPVSSIAAMLITALVTLGVPIVALVLVNKKAKVQPLCSLFGAGTFIAFALVLESILHQIVFHLFGERLNGNIWLYALYGGLAAGLFEETGRYISMKLLMKKTLTKENALVYGIGYGGAEAVLLGSMTAVSNIVMSVMINTNRMDMLLSTVGASEKEAAMEQLAALSATPTAEYLMAGVERLLAFVLQLCLSYIIYRAVKDKKPALFVLALAFHFAVDATVTVLAKSLSIYRVEAILAVAVITIALITYRRYKAEKKAAE